MPHEHLIFVALPGLRRRDLEHMPRLRQLAAAGSAVDLQPTFPCVTSSVQAAVTTGKTPREHGIIGNGFYWRDRRTVELWVGRNGLIECDQLWNKLAQRRISSAVWMVQNIRDAAADFLITPEPIHHPDGRTEPWCYSKPGDLYKRLADDIGHFPLMNYWGPLVGIRSTEWIINGALWLIQRSRPRFNYIYIPHLDYAAQKFGPNSPQAAAACREADEQLGRLFDGIAALRLSPTAILVAGEYAITDVHRVLYPNRILRAAGMLRVTTTPPAAHDQAPSAAAPEPSRTSSAGPANGVSTSAFAPQTGPHEYIDFNSSLAFAVVDHQFAHLYVRDKNEIDAVAGLFEGIDGIAEVRTGPSRAELDHPRSGEVVLVCHPDTWLAYYWWHDDAKAPPFARTIDIHAKPGYDPVEMFMEPPPPGPPGRPMMPRIPLDATLIKGSHGAPAHSPDQLGLIVASTQDILPHIAMIHDLDLCDVIAAALPSEPRP